MVEGEVKNFLDLIAWQKVQPLITWLRDLERTAN